MEERAEGEGWRGSREAPWHPQSQAKLAKPSNQPTNLTMPLPKIRGGYIRGRRGEEDSMPIAAHLCLYRSREPAKRKKNFSQRDFSQMSVQHRANAKTKPTKKRGIGEQSQRNETA